MLSVLHLSSAIVTDAPLTLLGSEYPLARCLDGSPGAFYHSRASADENGTKWVIFLQGGGECVDEASCSGRARTPLGSSQYMQRSISLHGFQSTNPGNNPDFATWNMLYIPYCSGDLHLGMQTQPSASASIQFSGHHILAAVLDTAATSLGLSNARNVLFTGESAGGIGCVAHIDFLAQFVSNVTNGMGKTVAAPVGGYYYSNEWPYNATRPAPVEYIPWTYSALATYYKYWNAWTPVACRAVHEADPHKCMFAQTSYPFIKTPTFVIEAQTDKVVMPLHNGLPAVWDNSPSLCDNQVKGCPASVLNYMASWRNHMASAIHQVGALENKTGDGLFHPACLIHVEFTIEAPRIHNRNYLQAVGDWMFARSGVRSSYRYVDTCEGVMCGYCTADLVEA